MPNNQLYGKEARAALLKGVDKLNRAVSVTLGPAGRNVLFRHMGAIITTKDGVTVAREVNLPDVYESIGADLIKSAAGQTVDEAGDGTTTAVLLAHAIFAEGVKAIDKGAEPTQLVRGIERAVTSIVGEYDSKAKKFRGGVLERFAVETTPELAYQAARISANGDDAIAKVVSEAVLQCGPEADIQILRGTGPNHTMEKQDGLKIDAGMVHPYFINEPKRAQCILEEVTIALINRRISTADEAGNILTAGIRAAQSNGRPVNLLILCDDMDPEALQLVLKNRLKAEMPIPCVVVRTPLFADMRRDLLEDIAAIAGGRRIESPKGKSMESLTSSDFGYAQKIVVAGSSTVITARPLSDFEREKRFLPHLEQIEAIIGDENRRPDEIDFAKKRRAALTGGVAVIRVGGTSVNAIKETEFRVDDALHATRAAVVDGVVPGGGSALLFASVEEYGSAPCDVTSTKGEAMGEEILLQVLRRPIEQIAENAGHKPQEVVASVVDRYDEGFPRCGFDAATGRYEDDMIAAGIVDPLRVVRTSLNAAASAAATTLLKTEAVLGHIPEGQENMNLPFPRKR